MGWRRLHLTLVLGDQYEQHWDRKHGQKLDSGIINDAEVCSLLNSKSRPNAYRAVHVQHIEIFNYSQQS